jgi:hypothetical protein
VQFGHGLSFGVTYPQLRQLTIWPFGSAANTKARSWFWEGGHILTGECAFDVLAVPLTIEVPFVYFRGSRQLLYIGALV